MKIIYKVPYLSKILIVNKNYIKKIDLFIIIIISKMDYQMVKTDKMECKFKII